MACRPGMSRSGWSDRAQESCAARLSSGPKHWTHLADPRHAWRRRRRWSPFDPQAVKRCGTTRQKAERLSLLGAMAQAGQRRWRQDAPRSRRAMPPAAVWTRPSRWPRPRQCCRTGPTHLESAGFSSVFHDTRCAVPSLNSTPVLAADGPLPSPDVYRNDYSVKLKGSIFPSCLRGGTLRVHSRPSNCTKASRGRISTSFTCSDSPCFFHSMTVPSR